MPGRRRGGFFNRGRGSEGGPGDQTGQPGQPYKNSDPNMVTQEHGIPTSLAETSPWPPTESTGTTTPHPIPPIYTAAIDGGHAGDPNASLKRSPYSPFEQQDIGDGSFVRPGLVKRDDQMSDEMAIGIMIGMVLERVASRLPGAKDRSVRDADRQRRMGIQWAALNLGRQHGDKLPRDITYDLELYMKKGPLSKDMPDNLAMLRKRGIIGRSIVRASHKVGDRLEELSKDKDMLAFLGTTAVFLQKVDRNKDGSVGLGEIGGVFDKWGNRATWAGRIAIACAIIVPGVIGWKLNSKFFPRVETVAVEVAPSNLVLGSSAQQMTSNVLVIPAGTPYSSYPVETTTDESGDEVTVMYQTDQDLAAVGAASVQDQFPGVPDDPDGRVALNLPPESMDNETDNFKYVVAELGGESVAVEVPADSTVQAQPITGTCSDGSPKTRTSDGQDQRAMQLIPISPQDKAGLDSGTISPSLGQQIEDC